MIFQKLNKRQIRSRITAFNQTIKALEKALIVVKKNSSKTSFYFSYELESQIEKLKESRNEFLKQQSCKHPTSTGLRYVGHDSHKSYYEDRCKECSAVLAEDWD